MITRRGFIGSAVIRHLLRDSDHIVINVDKMTYAASEDALEGGLNHNRHILVKTEKEAQDVLAQLKGGAKFEDLAKKVSIDPAGAKGGDLGWFGKGAMIPEFEKVAFAMKEGETSGIVKTKFGFHIIKLTGKRAAGILPFAEVKEQLKTSLMPEKQQEVFKKVKEDLKKNAKLTIKEDALTGIGTKAAQEKTPPIQGIESK
jgi:peptidyl-prolyl cis-trans isomerase C